MRFLLLLLLVGLTACDSEREVAPTITCDRVGLGSAGTLRATVRSSIGDLPFEATCLRATLQNDRIVIRGMVIGGSVIESDLSMTAVATAPGALSIADDQASARFIFRGATYEAVEGGITLAVVSGTAVVGAFSFETAEGVSVVDGEFSIPR